MFAVILATASLIATSYAACDFPNGTDTTFNWWQGPGTGSITFSSAAPVDASGNPEYPIRLVEPLHVKLHFNNQEAVLSNIAASIKLYSYGGFAGCSWSEVYTFGLLDNLDACALGVVACPVQLGDQDGLATLDFTKYSVIIGLLKNDSPYQLQLTLTDKNTGHYVTIVSQARALTQ